MRCDGCRACCLIEPSLALVEGDDPSLYETVEVDGVTRLAPTGKGSACRYLGPTGCTIHDRRPQQCRAFDCRVFAANVTAGMNRHERRRFVARHPYRDVFKAGIAKAKEPA